MYTRLTETQSAATRTLNARLLALSRERRALREICQRCGTDPRFTARAIAMATQRAGFPS